MHGTSTPPWWQSPDQRKLVHAYILNLDLAASSQLEKADHVLDMQHDGREFQETVEKILQEADFFFEAWSGDGLVALCPGEAYSRKCVECAIKILDAFEGLRHNKLNQGREYWKTLGVRIAIVHGELPWAQHIGSIIAAPMNIAGHLQKGCPHNSIILDTATYNKIGDKELQSRFVQDTLIRHGNERINGYSYRTQPPVRLSSATDMENSIVADFFQLPWKPHRVVRCPGALYLIGEFANIFGFPALIVPIPLYCYVAIAKSANSGLTVTDARWPPPAVDYSDSYNGLAICRPTTKSPFDGRTIDAMWSVIHDWCATINKSRAPGKIIKGIQIAIESLIPPACGLNASSALCSAIAVGVATLMWDDFENVLQYSAGLAEAELHLHKDERVWQTYKLAWALDNVFHRGAASGCGVFAAMVGTQNHQPLLFIGEKRGLTSGFPFEFGPKAIAAHDFLRLRSRGYRVGTRKDTGFEFALLLTRERTRSTGEMIEEFLRRSTKLEIVSRIAGPMVARHDMIRESVVRVVESSFLDKAAGYPFINKNVLEQNPCRDSLVEWLAESLGCVAVSAIEAYAKSANSARAPTKHDAAVQAFLKYVNAYQELLSAVGVSAGRLDIMNVRSDSLAFEIRPDEQCAFGTKLTGGGGGGDLVVIGPSGELQREFPTIRRHLREKEMLPPLHFISWATDGSFGKAVVELWPKNGRALQHD